MSTIDENNERLKCYMGCFFRALYEAEVSQEMDVLDGIPLETMNILIEMFDSCPDYEEKELEDHFQCQSAFELNKCWKTRNPKVSSLFAFLNLNVNRLLSSSLQYYFLL